jgi:dihydrofolate synthase / folylpolyglutamate synthase
LITALPADLEAWLAYIEGLHPATIDMGLDRINEVLARLDAPKTCPLFIVGGTNGKGSTCTMLEAILLSAGYRVGKYLSPHLIRFNERVRVDGREATDAELIAGFAAVERARGDTQLTYFEFTTLAAWVSFAQAKPEALVLEVGLGGRLDAVNAFEPDCSILTNVAMDHMDYLGDTRERIGWEKAHIFRAAKPAICADPEPPQSVLDHAAQIGADLRLLGRDFGFEMLDKQQWLFGGRIDGEVRKRSGLPYPSMRGGNQLFNASACLAALEALRERLPVGAQDIRQGLLRATLPGRFQVLPGRPTVILDVGHNPHAALVLRDNLENMGFHSNTRAVVGMLRDKDMGGVFAALRGRVDAWYVATLDNSRGARASELAEAIESAAAGGTVQQFDSPQAAYLRARSDAGQDDRILVFGSFYTVGDVMQAIAAQT